MVEPRRGTRPEGSRRAGGNERGTTPDSNSCHVSKRADTPVWLVCRVDVLETLETVHIFLLLFTAILDYRQDRSREE